MKKLNRALCVLVAIFVMASTFASLEIAFPQTASAAMNPAADADSSTIRIKLSYNNRTEMPIIIDGVYSILEKQELGALARGNYKVVADNASGTLRLLDNNGATVVENMAAITLKRHTAPDGANCIKLTTDTGTTRNYLGDMKFFPKDTYVMAVNHVFLETYLYGVIGYEMSNSWP
ncbi:MAG: hypothetical protein Q8O09_03700, partial [Bacillota bacterium]|nr:hypothetical protein [Bacillota bacterium]